MIRAAGMGIAIVVALLLGIAVAAYARAGGGDVRSGDVAPPAANVAARP
jgi:hypothetical protein